jgi:hypothetical protein
VGVFDGLHRGHQVLLRAVLEKAPECLPLVISFRNNPKQFFSPGAWEGDILSLRQKLDLFREGGIPLIVLIDFSEEFSRMTGGDFLETLRVSGNPGYVAVGSNFHCGYRMDTGAEGIRSFFQGTGALVEVFESMTLGESRISSSRVRRAVRAGDLGEASELLGRPVELDLGNPLPGPDLRFRVSGRILPPPGAWPVLIRQGSLPPAEGEALVGGGGEITLTLPGNAAFHAGAETAFADAGLSWRVAFC